MLIVREESFTLTTGTTEWIWSPTSPRLGWFFSGSRWTIICKSLKQLFKSNLKEELVSWEQNNQIDIYANFRTLRWRHVQKRWIWKFYVKDISNERPGRVSRCSYQTSILFWRSSFSWRSQWANIYFFYNWVSSLCYCSSFEVHMLSLTASRMKFFSLFYSISTQ